MRISKLAFCTWLLTVGILVPGVIPAKAAARKEPQEKESEALRVVVDRIIAHENGLIQTLQSYRPRVETYLQGYQPDRELGIMPTGDYYFLGGMESGKDVQAHSFLPSRPGVLPHFVSTAAGGAFKFRYELDSFAQASLIDSHGLDREHYRFQFLRSEFLGEVRCLVFDVSPRDHAGRGQFLGRIWVEDHDYAIVRFNGVRVNPPRNHVYFHFDSWRQELQPKLWLPVYVYAEESDVNLPMLFGLKTMTVRFRSQTRYWGYDLRPSAREEELTRIVVDAPVPVHDNSETAADPSPLASQREWQNEAENNVMERLERARFIAPAGDFDKVLETVVNNLVVTNHLDYLQAIHCRVLLTLPFESFTVGNTIVLSRGLIDVIPDEATLAMTLAHELGHIALGPNLEAKYAFADRLSVSDDQLLGALDLAHSPEDETSADAKGLELLKNSPYKDNLDTAALFLRAMAQKGPQLPKLFGAHLGNRLADGNHLLRMAAMMQGAPQLQPARLDQMAALPLGSRLKIDAWSGKVELAKSKTVAPVSAREKMPFLVTPLFLNLTRKPSTTAPLPPGDKATAEYKQP